MKRTFIKMLPLVAAVLLATSCSKDSNDDSNVAIDPVETQNVASPTESTTIPFSITVGKDAESLSKATLQDETTTTQVFEKDDQLILKNGNTEVARLYLPTDYTSSTEATFTGDLETKDLVSGTTSISITLQNTTNGNPETALTSVQTAATLAEAFQKFGYWTSSFTYNQGENPTITLTQNTAFVKVDLPFHGTQVTFTIGGTPTVKYLNGNEIFAVPNGTNIASALLNIDVTVDVLSGDKKKVVYNIRSTETKPRTTPTDCIAGVFSVADNKQIFFSKSNMKYNSDNKTWGVMDNQYSYLNSNNGTRDLLRWNEYTGLSISEWSLLSQGEWAYLLGLAADSRANATDLCKWTKVGDVNGLMILPDGCSVSFDSGWSTLESAGAVFLPAAGHLHDKVYGVNKYAGMLVPEDIRLHIDGGSSTSNLTFENNSGDGRSVRLVRGL